VTRRVCVCIIRAVARLPTLPHTSAKQPRLNVTPCPHSPPCMLCIALSLAVLPFRVLRPIQREPIANQPPRNVVASNRTYRDCPPVSIQAHGRAINRPSRNEGVKVVRCLCDAAILQALIVATGVSPRFRRINPPIPLVVYRKCRYG
jgi:hypothetical protein